jgi:hypothetical protein
LPLARCIGKSGFGLGDEFQRNPIIAPALARGLRAVLELMAVMPAAFGTVIFGARQYQFVVGFFSNAPGMVVKNSASRCPFEFHCRSEYRQRSLHTQTRRFSPLRAGPRAFHALFAQHVMPSNQAACAIRLCPT